MKTALVTGSAGGLGQALCAALHDAGYRVVGTDLVDDGSGCDAFVALDLCAACTDAAALEAAAERLRAALGGEGLALLVNNAAVQILGGVGEVSLADWSATLTTNLTAPFFLAQALLPELERAQGVIVNVGSVHARATKPGFVAYATSKAALAGLTRAMAVDLGPRVRVVAVQPAAIDTVMLRAGFAGRPEAFAQLAGAHPLGRIAEPAEVARAIVFLAATAASFLTGTILDVDGGVLSRLYDPG
jgi:NAD(P)-dependent dehydrogenase (short-subunit alcohol dehydrogenase family)